MNGVSSYSSDIATNIQVHKSAQSGISEIAELLIDWVVSIMMMA